MIFKDLDIFLRAAAAILQGSDPYSIPGLEVFYPLPFYFLFVPFAGLPSSVVYVIWTALQMGILLAILRVRALFVALSMPMLLIFLFGQVDIVMLGLVALLQTGIGGGIALAFLALKPQLVLLLAPWMLWYWWRNDRRQILWFALVLGAIVAMSFVVQPDWLLRFIARSGERTRAAISSSVWGLLSFLPSSVWLPVTTIVVAAIVVWAWRTDRLDIVATSGLFVSPFVFSYNLAPLLTFVRRPRFLVAFTAYSWIAFGISAFVFNDAASAGLTLIVLAAVFAQSNASARKLGNA